MNLLTPFWSRTLSFGFWLVAAALLLISGCVHSNLPEAAREPNPGACKRSSSELALAVRDQSAKFEICARLTERNDAGEYVLGFVATPWGEPLSVTLLGADLEPLGGQAPDCFAAVVEVTGLARSGGGECPVTVPIVVPTPTTKLTGKVLPARTRDADGWLVSALESVEPVGL